MVSGLLDEAARGQAAGLERDLRGRVDGDVRLFEMMHGHDEPPAALRAARR